MTAAAHAASVGLPTRVLVVSGVWPHHRSALEAANVVNFAIVRHLALDPRFDVQFGVLTDHDLPWPIGSEPDRDELLRLGVTFHPPVVTAIRPPARRASRLALVAGAESAAVPGALGSRDAAALAQRGHPDVVLTVWSEVATAAFSRVAVPKLAYYGNVLPRLVEAGYAIESELTRPTRSVLERLGVAARRRLVLAGTTRAHLRNMRRYDAIADVAANDARFYREHGLNQAYYLRNMWPETPDVEWEQRREDTERTAPLKIAGNVGNLSATGNTFGLHTIATQIAPALRKRLGTGGFEIHLYGGGAAHPAVRDLLVDPDVRVRGFVPDLDAELLSAPVFLVANNHSRFKVGHTRFLHAWSLGGCAVAFTGSREAMPEIEDGVNALLGETAEEVADQVVAAGADVALRRRIGHAGWSTASTLFSPAKVCSELSERLLAVARP